MENWGFVMSSLQDNMSKLLEKVSTMSQKVENEGGNTHKENLQDGEKNLPEKFEEGQHSLESQVLNQSQTLGEYLEDFKKTVTVYMENVLTQNQTIITDNHKLRQSLGELSIKVCVIY